MLWLLSPLVSFHSLSCSPPPPPFSLSSTSSPLSLFLSICPPNAVFDKSTFSPCFSQSSIWLSTLCLTSPHAHTRTMCTLILQSGCPLAHTPAAPCTKTDQHKCAVHTCMNTLLCSMMGCCLFDCDTTVPCTLC